jgi:hypothetical protein
LRFCYFVFEQKAQQAAEAANNGDTEMVGAGLICAHLVIES